VSGLRGAVSFLTPVGGAAPPDPRSLSWFPLVGLAIGASLGALSWATDRAWPALVAAVIVVAADLLVTGGLHFDGLVDSADGLLPPLSAERRLEVMADPAAGAFGVAVAGVFLVGRIVALAAASPRAHWRAILLLAGLWCLSRSVMVLATTLVPYARAATGGLASGFLGQGAGSARTAGMAGVAVSLGLLLGWRPLAAPFVLVAALTAASAVVVLAKRRIGGYTGDVLGAAGLVAETAGLIVAAARW
jgi:adenosylcobinamide-GDP ribazoletransferase